jgi:hypothetical protein
VHSRGVHQAFLINRGENRLDFLVFQVFHDPLAGSLEWNAYDSLD